MNPISTGTRSPGHPPSPNASASAQGKVLEQTSYQTQWRIEGTCTFPVYSRDANVCFKQIFSQNVKTISLQLQEMMICLSKISPDAISTSWQAFSALASCLGNNLPKHIPLSIFTSSVVVACIENIEHVPPAKKRKPSDSSEESELRNQLLASAQRLANTICSTLALLKIDLHLNHLKGKNPEPHQAQRAFQHTISQRLAVECSVVLDNPEQELAGRIISAIDPFKDMCSFEAKSTLLSSATSEFMRMQDTLISDAYTGLAHRKKPLPLTGKNLLATCKEHSASDVSASANMEGWPSWENRIFFFLARCFLQKNDFIVPDQTDVQGLLTSLALFHSLFANCPSTASPYARQQYALLELAKWFVKTNATKSSKKFFDTPSRYNEFLQCSTSIASLLKGLFMLETSMPFSLETLPEFQIYAQTLPLHNTTEAMNAVMQEVVSICYEEHQNNCTDTKLLLEETEKLLKQFMVQSIKLIRRGYTDYKNTSFQDFPHCEWMPNELRLSKLFCNMWKEAKWEHCYYRPLVKDVPKSSKCPAATLLATSAKLEATFLQFCNILLINVLEEMPSGLSENVLDWFSSSARALQAKTITTYEPASHLFTIGTNFITTSEEVVLHNSILIRAKQDFEEAQKKCIACTYSFILKHENYIPTTKKTFLAYCAEQYKQTMNAPAALEQLPHWGDCIFLCLVQVFLEKKQMPIPVLNSIKDGFKIVKKYFPPDISTKTSTSSPLMFFTKTLADMILLLNQEPISPTEPPQSSAIVYDNTAYETLLQSVASFNKVIQALFKLDTGKAFSKNNIREFQRYLNKLLLCTENPTTKDMLLGSFSVYLENSKMLNEPQRDISDNLAKISDLLKKLINEAFTLLTLNKTLVRKSFTPEITVLSAFQSICSVVCVPRPLLFSEEMLLFWEEAKNKSWEQIPLSQIPQHLEHTSQMYPETASELTRCFLKLCKILLVEISNELLLEPAPSRLLQRTEEIQTQKFIETSFILFPQAIVNPSCRKSILFKEIVKALAIDKASTGATECLTLAIETFLTAQQTFVCSTYAHLIKHKLPLPRTGKDLLISCKKQYGSSTSIPASLGTLSSWNNNILCSLARVFFLSKGEKPTSDFQPWNSLYVIEDIAPFFKAQDKTLMHLPEEVQIKEFIVHLVQSFSSSKPVETRDKEPDTSEIDPYLCKAYDNFLESAALLGTFCRTLFQIGTGNNYSPQQLTAFHAYIARLLVNSPGLRKKILLQDLAIICSENNDTLEQKQIWQDLHHVNALLSTLMEVSLSLMLFCGTMDKELTPKQAVETALQITSSITHLPLDLKFLSSAFITSLAGTHALKSAMDAYVSGTLCRQLFEQSRMLLQGAEPNPLQAAIDAHVSGQVSPEVSATYKKSLSSVFLSTKEALESVCKTLYTSLKADIMPAISKEPSPETPSEKFITTANNTHKKMMSEKPLEVPLFQSLVLILAQEYDDDLQTRSAASSDQFMRTQPETSAAEEPENDVNTSMWKNIIGVLLEEEQQAIRDKENLSAIVQTTGTGEALPELLQEEDFTNLLEEAGDFTDFLEQSGDFTDFLEQDFSFEEETEEDPAS